MAPISADAARPVQKQQARRPVSRIVPAIPLRLSRRVPAAKPTPAEQPHKDPVTSLPAAEPPVHQPAEEEEKKTAEEQPAQPIETPVAPESEATAEQPESEPEPEPEPVVGAEAPAQSQHEEVQQAAEVESKSQKLPHPPQLPADR